MTNRLLEFISESFLFDDSALENRYSSFGEVELLKELENYRVLHLSDAVASEKAVRANTSNLKLFNGSTHSIFSLLKQSALYLDEVVIADPVFPHTHNWSQNAKTMNDFVGAPGGGAINREKLAESAHYLKQLVPMIQAAFVCVLPITALFEPPEVIPYRASLNGFSDVLPEPLLDFYRERAIVEAVKKTDHGMIIDGSNQIGRTIHIRFQDHLGEDARGYLLMEQIVKSVDEKTRQIETVQYMPESPPDKARYDAWVYQSINQTAEHSYKRLLLENSLAEGFGASYLCTTPFTFELLEQFFPDEQTIAENTVNSLLRFDLPLMEQIDVSTLMRIRNEDGEAFQNFRNELDRLFRELRLVADPKELKIKTENAWHELSNVQVANINQKVKHLESQLKLSIVIGAAGLFGAIQTGGFSLIAAGIAAAQGYKSYKEYQFQQRQNPSFFLWKARRK